ncbi:MAG: DinB family protein [bacterium]
MPPSDVITALDDQLRRSMEGVAWHGPSVREALDGISAADAALHPIPGAHSVWELVLHLCGTYRLVLRRLDGDASPLLPHEDWPTVPEPTEAHWRRDVDSLYALNARLRAAVRDFPRERLFEPIVTDPSYPAFTQFIGLTQHDLYHAGQIVLLNRAQREYRAS